MSKRRKTKEVFYKKERKKERKPASRLVRRKKERKKERKTASPYVSKKKERKNFRIIGRKLSVKNKRECLKGEMIERKNDRKEERLMK